MSETNETIADIVAEMHKVKGFSVPYAPSGHNGVWTADLVKFADRIEDAWRTEKAEIEARALEVGGMIEASRHKEGNAAAMREALVAMVKAETDGSMEREDLCGRCLEKMFDKCKHDGSCWVDKVMNAISEPPRNCDRFMSIEQARTAYCSECGRIITIWDGYVAGLFEEWLFSPATERKGENNEK